MTEIPDTEKSTRDWEALPDVVILRIHICSMLVCAKNGTDTKKIEAIANREHPTGIDFPWRVDKEFEAEACPDGRPNATHYVLSC